MSTSTDLGALTGDTSSPNQGGGSPTTPHKRGIEDCIMELEIIKVNRLACQRRPGDDTAIFLLPPPKAPGQTRELYMSIQERYAKPMFGKSLVFKEQAPAFYEANFAKGRQQRLHARFSDRLKYLGYTDIKYILDLTPELEGDNAIRSVVELQCPPGVIQWRLSTGRFGCPQRFVCGTDGADPIEAAEPYSQIRHNLAIERLMLAIHGYDPNFDSAVKVYTTAVLAKHFDITGSCVQDHVVTWIRNPGNAAFIEVLPEVTLTMAESLQVGALAIDAFAFLLGEALLEKDTSRSRAPTTTIHGRRRHDISEEWESRVQYAMQSMETRVVQHFRYLTADDMTWIDGIPEYQKLLEARNTAIRYDCLDSLTSVLLGLKRFVRTSIFYCLCMDIQSLPAMRFDMGSGYEEAKTLHPDIDYIHIWYELPIDKRIFTRFFWQLLESMQLDHLFDSRHKASEVQFFNGFQMTLEGGHIDDMSKYEIDKVITLGSIENNLRTIWSALGAFSVTPTPSANAAGTTVFASAPLSAIGSARRNVSSASDATSENEAHYWAAEAVNSFKLVRFFLQVQEALQKLVRPMLLMPKHGNLDAKDIRISNVLLCISDEEIRYLPLWAGGNDDGTGGVFNSEVPLAEENEGFSTHGPSIRMGADSREPSEYSFIAAQSDAPSSAMVHDGYSDTLNRHRVYAASEVAAENDNLWTDVLAHRDRRAKAELDREDREDEVASLGSEATETGPAKGIQTLVDEKEVKAAHDAENFNDYSDIFMEEDGDDGGDTEQEDEFDNADQDVVDEDDDDDDDDMEFIDASEALEYDPAVTRLPSTNAVAANRTIPLPEHDEGIIVFKRDIDQELMDRP